MLILLHWGKQGFVEDYTKGMQDGKAENPPVIENLAKSSLSCEAGPFPPPVEWPDVLEF